MYFLAIFWHNTAISHLVLGPRITAPITTVLTHWGPDKMGAIFQTTFSNACSWMKMNKFLLRFLWSLFPWVQFTHWGWVNVPPLARIMLLGPRQAIIWTSAGILLIQTLGTNWSEILWEIYTFSFKKMRLKVSSAKWRPFWLGPNVLTIF